MEFEKLENIILEVENIDLEEKIMEMDSELYGVLTIFQRVVNRIINKEHVLDSFFRVTQNTEFEEMMYKKPLLKRNSYKENFKACMYVFFKGDNKGVREEIVNEYKGFGVLFQLMVKKIEIEIEKRA